MSYIYGKVAKVDAKGRISVGATPGAYYEIVRCNNGDILLRLIKPALSKSTGGE